MRTLLLGLATHLTGDRAVGRVVAQRLASHGCQATVRLDGGDGANPTPDWADHDRVIVVEATADGRPPGTIHRAEHHTPPGAPHELLGDHGAVLEAMLQSGGQLPPHLEVLTISIPKDSGDGFSPDVQAAADRLVDELSQELGADVEGA